MWNKTAVHENWSAPSALQPSTSHYIASHMHQAITVAHKVKSQDGSFVENI